MINKVSNPIIFFDESGNTGPNLLDRSQPVFTLASCSFTIQDAEQLLKLTGSRSTHEVHFKRLRRRKSGQDGILRLMSSELLTASNIQISLFNKDFMVVTKIVDILIEYMMHCNGDDLYLNGRNIALSNMLYYCLPVFCNPDAVENMYKYFVAMIKSQTTDSIEQFYNSVINLKIGLIDKKYERNINLILDTKKYAFNALKHIDKTAMDPSIPALFGHCINWGEIYPSGFDIVHDDSQPVEKQKSMFLKYMDWTKDEIELGYDRRKFKLPLKAMSLNFSQSHLHPQLQVADIIASSFAHWASGICRGEQNDFLFLELCKLDLDRFVGTNKVWPTKDVSPEALGTVHNGGLNAANHIPVFLQN